VCVRSAVLTAIVIIIIIIIIIITEATNVEIVATILKIPRKNYDYKLAE
jgi:hypothetical protein